MIINKPDTYHTFLYCIECSCKRVVYRIHSCFFSDPLQLNSSGTGLARYPNRDPVSAVSPEEWPCCRTCHALRDMKTPPPPLFSAERPVLVRANSQTPIFSVLPWLPLRLHTVSCQTRRPRTQTLGAGQPRLPRPAREARCLSSCKSPVGVIKHDE